MYVKREKICLIIRSITIKIVPVGLHIMFISELCQILKVLQQQCKQCKHLMMLMNCQSEQRKKHKHRTPGVMTPIIYLVYLSVLISFRIGDVIALPPIIQLGAVFTEDQRSSNIESAFKYAVYRINKDKNILPDTQLVYDIKYAPRDDTFRTTKQVCRQLEHGVQVLFGPTDPLLAGHIQSICESFDLPHIETRIDLDTTIKEFSINLYPSQYHLNLAYRDLMVYLNWTKVAVIYEEDYGLFKQQDLMYTTADLRTEMYIRQASPDTYRQILRAIRQKEIYKIIDLETFDLEDFKYNSVNITAFRLVDVQSQLYTDIVEQMQKFPHSGLDIVEGHPYIQTQPALMFDAVYAFAAGLTAFDGSHTLKVTNLSCEQEVPWDDGLSLYNYINTATLNGLTGKIDFVEGRRKAFKVDLLKLKHERIQKVGFWTDSIGVNITDPSAFYDTNVANITLVVMTRQEKPYVMVKEDANLTGNARFEGFCIDLLKSIATQVGFHYKIELVPDNMYGVFNPETNTWNGIVRELMERRADLAVASMTINYARESVIDFTKPFMNLGIGILFKVPTSQPTRLFSFMNPLAMEIWLYVLAAYILVSFALFVMARFSPYEWSIPYSCQKDSDIVENQFSISNSFWFITGTFLRQSSGLNPKRSDRAQTRFFSFMNPLAVEIWIYIAFAYILVSLTIWIVARLSPIEWVPENPDVCDHEDCRDDASPEELIELQERPKRDPHNSNQVNSENRNSNHDDKNDDEKGDEKNAKQSTQLNDGHATWFSRKPYRHVIEEDVEQQQQHHHHHSDSECGETELESIKNDFTLKNSFWFAIGALMQQGSDLYPRATSTRIVGGIWWFFTLIIISSYTANLAAFLTVERMITPIESASDLAEQTDISYGTLEGGSTMTFFRDSKIGIYQKMWRYMENRKSSVFVKTYEEGIKRVMEGDYAFLMESTMLDYAVQRDCNLTQIGGLLDSKGYGIATPKGSPWRDPMSLAILELQEKGIIQMLYDKWWKNTGDVCNRDDKSKESKANALGVENIGGVFVVLLCGLALAVVVAILEFCYNSKKTVQTENQSLCSEMAEELRFAMHCHTSKQRPSTKHNCAKCMPASTYVPQGPTTSASVTSGLAGIPHHLSGVQYNYLN
uniref:Glutamate receptor ionotropic, kainate 2 n=1 Tax=Glossina austeni TaxID=7395 RepID=A0A1A9UIH8_GLOAU